MTTANIPAVPSAITSFEEGILIILILFLIMVGILIYRIILFLATLDLAAKEISRSSLPVLHHLTGVLRDTERLTHWVESMKEGLDKSAAEHLFSIFTRMSSVGNIINRVITMGEAVKNAIRAYKSPDGRTSSAEQENRGEKK